MLKIVDSGKSVGGGGGSLKRAGRLDVALRAVCVVCVSSWDKYSCCSTTGPHHSAQQQQLYGGYRIIVECTVLNEGPRPCLRQGHRPAVCLSVWRTGMFQPPLRLQLHQIIYYTPPPPQTPPYCSVFVVSTEESMYRVSQTTCPLLVNCKIQVLQEKWNRPPYLP